MRSRWIMTIGAGIVLVAAGMIAAFAAAGTGVVFQKTVVKGARLASLGPCGYTICTSGATGSTFANAVVAASAGDTITVQPGSYPAQTILQGSTKASGPAITFQGAGATVADLTLGDASTCVGAKHLQFVNFKITSQPTTRCGSEDITFVNLTAAGVNIGGGNGIHVVGGSFGPSDQDNSEIKNGATNVTIDSAIFHDYTVTDPAAHSECIQIWGSGVKNLLITNTIFRNCTDFDILIKGTGFDNLDFTNSFFDVPEPGNENTTLCNPNCPRGGSTLRFSTYSYPNSSVTNSMVNSGISVDIAGYVTLSGNYTGTIPSVPPATTTSSTTSTSTTTSTTSSSTTTTTTAPPPPPTDLQIFCNQFVPAIQAATYYPKWANANPNELSRWSSFRDSACAGNAPAPPSMSTKFGTALIAAGKEAIN